MTVASSSPRFLHLFLLTFLCILSTQALKAPNEIDYFNSSNRDFPLLEMGKESEVEPMTTTTTTTTTTTPIQESQLKKQRSPLYQDDTTTQNLRRRTRQQESHHDTPSKNYLQSKDIHDKNDETNFLLQLRQLYDRDDQTTYTSRRSRQASIGHWILSMSPLACIFICIMLSCPCRQLSRYSHRIHGVSTMTTSNDTGGDGILPSMAQNPSKRLQMVEDSLVTKIYTRPSKHNCEEMNHMDILILEKQQNEGKENQDNAGEVAEMGQGGLGNHGKQELSLSTIVDLAVTDDTESPSSPQTTVATEQADSDNVDCNTINEEEECVDEYYNDECQICLESFQINDKISWSTVSKCNHIFHHDCIIEWLKRHTTCPTCRGNFLFHEMPSPGHEEPIQQLDGGEHRETGAGDVMMLHNNSTVHNHNTNSNTTDNDENNDNPNNTTNNNG